jgi:UDP-2,3-diacylglucosamine hydrolase
MPGDKVYFVSDFHLGVDARLTSREREKKIVKFLQSIRDDAHTVFLLGDLFDFWFEYKRVVPKGFVRLLGTLAELKDRGIVVEVFTGNHDMWMFDYFEKELGIPVHKQPIKKEFSGKTFYLGHGDGLGPGDHGYKMIKRIFRSPVCQWLFARLHPNFGIGLANFWSSQSRNQQTGQKHFLGKENEWLYQFCNEELLKEKVDYFIFGHRHLPIDLLLDNNISRYINLGDWIHHYSYACFDGQSLQLLFFENEAGKIYSE